MDRARHRAEPPAPTTRRSTAAASGSRACRARTAAGPPSTPTTPIYYLNNIPFADHGALLDPPTVDVAARCVSMLAQLGEPIDSPRMKAALAYLEREQQADGSWFGRWGVNYVYGTWSALCALNAAGLDAPRRRWSRKAADWLIAIQNPDGGWGENCDSYKLDYKGYEPHPSGASQTAWALLGLMAAGRDRPSGGGARRRLAAASTRAPTASGRRTTTPAAASRASSTCATTAMRSSSRSGRWPATAT